MGVLYLGFSSIGRTWRRRGGVWVVGSIFRPGSSNTGAFYVRSSCISYDLALNSCWRLNFALDFKHSSDFVSIYDVI